MKRYYTQLYNLNQELIAQYKVRSNNHEELLSSLRQVNQIIQKTGRLRGTIIACYRNIAICYITVGRPKTDLVAACRESIKNSSTDILPKILRFGAEA
jgi:Bardet-Biedl syndrome 2 protein